MDTSKSNRISVCVSVTKDLAKHLTDMVLLYFEDYFNFFVGVNYHPFKKKAPSTPSPKKVKLIAKSIRI